MHALPLLLATACAVAVAPALLAMLGSRGHTKRNYRGRELPFPFVILALAAALVALIPLALVQRLGHTGVFHPEALPVALYALGVIALGLVDDAFGGAVTGQVARRGWR